MCGSIADIQSPTAEIRRGKKRKKKKERKKKPQDENIVVTLFQRAAINSQFSFTLHLPDIIGQDCCQFHRESRGCVDLHI